MKKEAILQVEYLPVDALTPYENNARAHADADISAICESIAQFGFSDPIGIWSDENLIVEGHGRLEAAKRLGFDTVPCIRLDHLDDAQRRAYALAHNKTAELSKWDFEKLELEINSLPAINFTALGFETLGGAQSDRNEWFDREEKDGNAHEEGNDEYNAFVDKFEQPKTTDDCYTPENVYEAVAEWVANEYGRNKADFVRPFYPGGDYQREKYKKGCTIVDNPPFSILSEILKFYNVNKIDYFLFCPGLLLGSACRNGATIICTDAQIMYENKAIIKTNFVTNMEPGLIARAVPELFQNIKEKDTENRAELTRTNPVYKYPANVQTAASLNYMAHYGVAFAIKRESAVVVDDLDAMKPYGKTIFGDGLLLSDSAAQAAAEAADKAAEEAAKTEGSVKNPIVWELSDREREIIKGLK